MLSDKVQESPSHPLPVLAARGRGGGPSVRVPRRVPPWGRAAFSEAPVWQLVLWGEGRPRAPPQGWAGGGGPRLQAGRGTCGLSGLCPDSWRSSGRPLGPRTAAWGREAPLPVNSRWGPSLQLSCPSHPQRGDILAQVPGSIPSWWPCCRAETSCPCAPGLRVSCGL